MTDPVDVTVSFNVLTRLFIVLLDNGIIGGVGGVGGGVGDEGGGGGGSGGKKEASG